MMVKPFFFQLRTGSEAQLMLTKNDNKIQRQQKVEERRSRKMRRCQCVFIENPNPFSPSRTSKIHYVAAGGELEESTQEDPRPGVFFCLLRLGPCLGCPLTKGRRRSLVPVKSIVSCFFGPFSSFTVFFVCLSLIQLPLQLDLVWLESA
ncbi:hypothetical protein M440DRAFT_1158680 [Trichoderma longibrachiatum ATCC 18648]|uniref:Uncharacterized protein n=1 Tax=Trichoderma longibrachiatum ATCC 18648 TaxID=983965 RepID=A0A2T4CBZ5_TRILO|nr:hypothetical protein M440DRAFT_1158680 [Trichoderma longibrachiatum ATCC 18648]